MTSGAAIGGSAKWCSSAAAAAACGFGSGCASAAALASAAAWASAASPARRHAASAAALACASARGLRLGGGMRFGRGLRGSGGLRLGGGLRPARRPSALGLRPRCAAASASRARCTLSSCAACATWACTEAWNASKRASSAGAGDLQEAGGELVQQAADLFGDVVVQARLVRRHQARLRDLERVLEAARQRRQVGVAHGGRIAGQRMRQRDGLLADRARQLQHPLGERGAQAARLLVGLVQEDVEQAQADAQRADDLVVLGVVGRQLGADGERVERGVPVAGASATRRRWRPARRCAAGQQVERGLVERGGTVSGPWSAARMLRGRRAT